MPSASGCIALRWQLIKAPDLEAMLRVIYYNLREDFTVPHVSIRLWSETDHPPLAEFGPASQEVRVFAESLNHPYCSGKPMFETGQWFGEAEAVVEVVCLRAAAGGRGLRPVDPRQRGPAAFLPRNGHAIPRSASVSWSAPALVQISVNGRRNRVPLPARGR